MWSILLTAVTENFWQQGKIVFLVVSEGWTMKVQRCSSDHRGLAYLPSVDSWTFQQEKKSHPWGIQRAPIKAHIRCRLSLSCSAPSFSVCCTPPASLTFLEKKKKIRVATFHHAGDALKDLKKINVSFKGSVRISSGDGTRCQKRHLCCVTHTVSWSLCLFTSKGRCGIWGWCGWGETGEVDMAGPHG